MPPRKKTETVDTAAPNFEQALERLEVLVREMEAGSLSLEQMIAHFEEGQKLANLCGARLNELERRIEKLVSPEGKTVPFNPELDDDDEEDLTTDTDPEDRKPDEDDPF